MIHLVDYGLWCIADVFAVGDKRVVRFPRNPDVVGTFGSNPRPSAPSFNLYLNRQQNYWSKDLGIAVVDNDDLEPCVELDVDSAM
jgi:hypothetical protein